MTANAESGRGGGQRELTFLLARWEKPILVWLAQRVPRRIRSNHLTGLGVIGATGTGIAYALTNYSHAWLWMASAMLTSPTSLVPLLDLGLRVEFRPDKGSVQVVPAQLCSSQLADRQALVAVVPPPTRP